MSNDNIRHPKKPTPRDLKILEYMNNGNSIDNLKAMQIFHCAGLRDCLYRLRQDGFIIFHKDITYTTKENEVKSYRSWYTKEPSGILESGAKTDKEVNYKKVSTTAAEIAGAIINKSKEFVQPELF